VVADRADRKRLMIASDLVRAAAVGGLAALVALHPVYWPIPLLAFLEGVGESFFSACQSGALRALVPEEQLASAVTVQQGRFAAVNLAGPPLGGLLFEFARALPFAADALSYGCSLLSFAFVRRPLQEQRRRGVARFRQQLSGGLSFLWREPFLRFTIFAYAIGNFTTPGVLFVLIVLARRGGLTGTRIGLLLTAFSVAVLAGTGLSPLVCRRLSLRSIVLLEQGCGLLPLLYLAIPNVYVLLAAVLPLGLAIPITQALIITRSIQITPDALLGRVESVRATIMRAAGPPGPLAAGLIIGASTPGAAIAFFGAAGVLLTVWAGLTPALKA
jgi:predicted MFS family arabinose efflux permease